LFEGMEMLMFNEVEEDGQADGATKHWHVFDIIARRLPRRADPRVLLHVSRVSQASMSRRRNSRARAAKLRWAATYVALPSGVSTFTGS
jgi:hypothetical protein